MMMIDLEEGDAPPENVVDQTVTGCEARKRKPANINPAYNIKGADEVNKIVESYSRQHKYAISKTGPKSSCASVPVEAPA